MKTVVVVIIAHKNQLSDDEQKSLAQCYKILGRHEIRLVCPEGLDVSVYKRINPSVEVDYIHPKWQSTYAQFNELKKSRLLLERYQEFRFVLFYELDAWVFKDDLEYWCSKEFDYIGAPWFTGWHEATEEKVMIGVGNGGLSLRKIDNGLVILNRVRLIRALHKMRLTRIEDGKFAFRFNQSVFNKIFKIKDPAVLQKIVQYSPVNEDFFWCMLIGKAFSDFNIAPVTEARHFSFEANPALLFKENNGQLPFGCHAWRRYDPAFWAQHIN